MFGLLHYVHHTGNKDFVILRFVIYRVIYNIAR